MADEQRDATQSVSNGQYNAQAANGSTATVNITNNFPTTNNSASLKTPWQIPQLTHYVPRLKKEQELQSLLVTNGPWRVVLLHGAPGVGKTSLAASVALQMTKVNYPDGVFWGGLDGLSTNDQLLRFLGALNPDWFRNTSQPKLPLRDAFWNELTQKRALIVLDDVRDITQLIDLLPPTTYQGSCQILVLNDAGLHESLPDTIRHSFMTLTAFSETEALELFGKYLGHDRVEHHQEKFLEIAQLLDYLPQLLAIVARELINSNVSLDTYFRELRRKELGAAVNLSGALANFDALVRELPAELREMLTFLGALGDSDWSEEMVAAITLMPIDTVREQLTELVKRELVRANGGGRFRATMPVRILAQKYLDAETPYVQRATQAQLANYCLDRAQRLVDAVQAQHKAGKLPQHTGETLEQHIAKAFRQDILIEIGHIRQSIRWAVQHEAWDILRRFTAFPYIDQVDSLIANSFEIRLSLLMATIREPLIWLQGGTLRCHSRTSLITTNWAITPISDRRDLQPDIEDEGQIFSIQRTPSRKECCELHLNIEAGRIIDGIFDSMRLIDAAWVSVQALNLICKHVDIVGGRFLACDLRYSTWVDCDARQLVARATNFSYARLRSTPMRNADLQGIDFTGAVLEDIDLRGASLRGVQFVNAILDQVDLRGADLRGASFVHARLIRPRLKDCELADAIWAGAEVSELALEDQWLSDVIKSAAENQIQHLNAIPKRSLWQREKLECSPKKPVKIVQADLRGLDLTEVAIHDAELKAADLRAAQFVGASLIDTYLGEADLRAADLTNARLTGSDLHDARLRGAVLHKTDLERAKLPRVQVRNAYLAEARLMHADLQEANLERACLYKANLTNAKLHHANLH
jgi:uncharacterized protein YjbI with pentapeptide repeats